MGTFLDKAAGRIRQMTALLTSAGAADANKLVQTNALGYLDPSLLPPTIGEDVLTITASENLAAGDLVNIHDNAGTANARKADATAEGKEADGFVIAAATSGTDAAVYFEGRVAGLAGLTIGARYYTSTTAGLATATPPSGTGNVCQYVGRAISATEIAFEGEDGVILA